MKHKFWWIACSDCQRRQYLGADLESTDETISELLECHTRKEESAQAGLALHGLGITLSMGLKFILLHGDHKLRIMKTSQGDDPYEDLYSQEWPIEGRSIVTPAWNEIAPLGMSDAEIKRQNEVERLNIALRQVQETLFDLRMKVDAKTDGERLRIAKEFREYVEQNGGVLVGPAAVDTEEYVLPGTLPHERGDAAILMEQQYVGKVSVEETE